MRQGKSRNSGYCECNDGGTQTKTAVFAFIITAPVSADWSGHPRYTLLSRIKL